ncbi:MAG: TIGR04219 family outer membrane beta-barrel protein [Nitrospirae bacterium]|nr:TIGR04219 family outer membrane beta-barrel protein [Nitrospirota bacterium]
MLKFSKLMGIFIFFSVFFIPQIVLALGGEVALGVWYQRPDGNLQYKGDSLGLASDLKYDSKSQMYARVKAELPLFLPNIYIMATPMKFKGTGIKAANFQFDNQNFTANNSYSTELTLDHYDFAFYYGVPFVKTATKDTLNVDAGLNLRVIDFKIKIDQPATNQSISKSLTLPVPMGYLGAQIKIHEKVSIEADLRGISFGNAHYYDVVGRIKGRVINAGILKGFIAAGYRYEDISIDAEDIKAGFKFSGPFAEVGVEF